MKRRWPVDLVEAAWYALDLKVYEHNGERRFRLGDKVVPILPRRNEFPQQTANGGSAA